MAGQHATTKRRERLRSALLDAAEHTIAEQGLIGLRARDLAAAAGCAVGAIYNVVADLDELVMAVNSRTLAALEQELQSAAPGLSSGAAAPDAAIADLVALATTYVAFAAANVHRWRALFEHRLPSERAIPDWYREDQQRLFARVETPLSVLQPDLPPAERALLARSLFSAVHGLVALGLEEKLQAVPLPRLREQTTILVTALGRGLSMSARTAE